ncbi:MAG: hypothetical protein CM15mP53_06400 [Ectothiorhodospiraceae bacterium]|nr:MAG: hypothetical protein CM15mP53_06400 [Ectothiorhodospiraceae bacterium]
MKMSDTLDVGVAMTITYAMLEAGLTGSGGMFMTLVSEVLLVHVKVWVQ